MTKNVLDFFDKLEDKTRAKLSRLPLFYALLGGVGVVLFWRGIWHIADDISLNSILSLVIGSFILLITGVFVSAFVGNRLIISGLSGEKKLTEKTKEEIETEEDKIDRMQKTLNRMEQKIEEIDSEINHK
jgi:hypothetical protein